MNDTIHADVMSRVWNRNLREKVSDVGNSIRIVFQAYRTLKS